MKLKDLLLATAVAANAIKENIANLYDAGTAALASGIQSPTNNGNEPAYDTVHNFGINAESASSSQQALDRDIPRTGGDLSSASGDDETFYSANEFPEDNYCDEDSELYDCIPHPDDLYDDILSDIAGLFQESNKTTANSHAVNQDATSLLQDVPTELKQIALSGSIIAPDDLGVISDIGESQNISSYSPTSVSEESSTEPSKAALSDSKAAADQVATSISQEADLKQMTRLQSASDQDASNVPSDIALLSDESNDSTSYFDITVVSHESSTELPNAAPLNSNPGIFRVSRSTSLDTLTDPQLKATLDKIIADESSDALLDIFRLFDESNDANSRSDSSFDSQESSSELDKASSFDLKATEAQDLTFISQESPIEHKQTASLDSTAAQDYLDVLSDLYRLFEESNNVNSHSDGISDSEESLTELKSSSQETPIEQKHTSCVDSTAAQDDLDVLSDLYRLFEESNNVNSHSDGISDSEESLTELKSASQETPIEQKYTTSVDSAASQGDLGVLSHLYRLFEELNYANSQSEGSFTTPFEQKHTAAIDSTAAQDYLDVLSDLYRLFEEANNANSHSDGTSESEESLTELKMKATEAQDVTFISQEKPFKQKHTAAIDSTAAQDDLDVLSDLYRLFEEASNANSHSDGTSESEESLTELKMKASEAQDVTFISQETPFKQKHTAAIDSTAAQDDIDVFSDLYRLFEQSNDANPSSDSLSVSEDSSTQLTAPTSSNVAIPLYSSDTLSHSSTSFTPEQLDLMANWILFMLGPSTKDDKASSRLSEDNDDFEFFRRLSEFLEELDASYFSRELTDEDFDGFLEFSPSDPASFATTTNFESCKDLRTGPFSSLKDSDESSATHDDDALNLPVKSSLPQSDSTANSALDNFPNAQYSIESVNRDSGRSDVILHSPSNSMSSVTEALVLSSDDGGSSLGYLEPASLPSDSAVSSSQSSVGNENDNGSHVRDERNRDDTQVMTVRGTELETASSSSTEGASGFSFARFVSAQKLPIYVVLSVVLALIIIVVFSRYRKRQKRLAVNEMFASMQIPSRHEVV